jgi:hypothetical protein
VNEDEQALLKTVVDFTGARMQKPLNQFIRTIQNAKSSLANSKDAKKEGKAKGGKDNNNEGLTVTKVKKSQSNIMLLSEIKL